ncbi:glycerol-3-phosphate responsive antiterminator [Peptoniphilus mikwangii]|uniref:glycerol-3-phosphate responsive antiterminator n=1 Tax=Peptoniphilus mikwangii TaxID=1354300 RepID=UPI0003FF2354|nr:glycerol-3-phosphate responsive antiterminator [Peptoniphilus mikwangii]
MSGKKIIQCIEENPIILAVKNEDELRLALKEDAKIVFLLFGDLLNIADEVCKVKECGKYAIVHIDLIDGLSSKEVAVDFIKKYTKADGIISTRPKNIKRAKELSLFTVLRLFILDSIALQNLEKNIETSKPDMVEILPGVIPKIIKKVTSENDTPVIAGGLISDKEDAMNALKSGAVAISSSNPKVWRL